MRSINNRAKQTDKRPDRQIQAITGQLLKVWTDI